MRMKRWRQETIGEILEFTINMYLFLTVKLNKEHGNELAVNLIMPEGNISSCSPDGPPSVLLLYWLILCFFVCLFVWGFGFLTEFLCVTLTVLTL